MFIVKTISTNHAYPVTEEDKANHKKWQEIFDPGGATRIGFSNKICTKEMGQHIDFAVEEAIAKRYPDAGYTTHLTFPIHKTDQEKEIEFNFIMMFVPIPGGYERHAIVFLHKAFICNERGDTINTVYGFRRKSNK